MTDIAPVMKSEFTLLVKTSCLIISAVAWAEVKNLQRSQQAYFLVDFTLLAMCCALVFQREPVFRLSWHLPELQWHFTVNCLLECWQFS